MSENGIQPQPEKLEVIKNWPIPHCLRDVRAFYELASYYRKFVKDFAAIAQLLSRLTRKNTPFVWTDETQKSFDKLKSALLATEILAYPRPDLPCLLDSDASDTGHPVSRGMRPVSAEVEAWYLSSGVPGQHSALVPNLRLDGR